MIEMGETIEYAWSPTTDEIAAVSKTADGPLLRVFRPDGSVVRQLDSPDRTTLVQYLAWSPDGTRIVVRACIGCKGDKYDDTPDLVWDLWALDATGRDEPVRITDSPQAIEQEVRWRSDGLIAFDRICGPGAIGCAVGDFTHRLIRPDGSDDRLDPLGRDGLMSPDGVRVAFTTSHTAVGTGSIIAVADSDGTDEIQLSDASGDDFPLAWSPDGAWIAYGHAAPEDQTPDYRVWRSLIVRVDGTGERQLTSSGGEAAWQPVPR